MTCLGKITRNEAMSVANVPTVTIGMPVYNGAKYIAEAIESILAQSFSDFELIIADNASTDETPKICRHYADQDDRIRIVRHPRNMGAAKNYNYLVNCASGQYFKWAAHDDLIEPDFLAACLQGFERCGKDIVLVYPNSRFADADLKTLNFPDAFLHCTSDSPAKRLKETDAALGRVTSVFGLFRRDTLLRTGLIGSHISSDYDLLIETALLGKIIKLDGEVLFTRRLHDGSSMRANKTRENLLKWFDPDARQRPVCFTTRYWRFLESVYRVRGLTTGQRMGASLAIAERMLRVRTGRTKRALYAMLEKRRRELEME